MTLPDGSANASSATEQTNLATALAPPRPGAALAADPPRTAAAARLLPGPGGNTALDRLVVLAARLLSSQSSQVSLLTGVQTVAAAFGADEGYAGSEGPLKASLCTTTADLGAPLVVADAGTDDRVSTLPPVASGEVAAYLGVPLVTAGGVIVGALCVFGPEPRAWSAYDVSVLGELATAVIAELELSALTAEYESSRLRWDVAIEAAGIGSFDWDLTTDRVDWDERLQALFGYAEGEFVPHITEAFRRIHADDRPVLDAAIADAVESRGTFRAEYRVVLPDGAHRWVAARGRVLAGPAGDAVRMLGTVYDITEVRTAGDRAAHLLETMATGFVSVDLDWRVTYLNASGGQVIGRTSSELVGTIFWDAFPDLRESDFGSNYLRAMAESEILEFEAYYDHLDQWFSVRAVPSAEGLAIYFLDITARRADKVRAEVAAERMALLATVTAELAAATLSGDAAAAGMASLVVPVLADWSVVTVVDDDEDDGNLRDVGWAHADPAAAPIVERYATHRFEGLPRHRATWQARHTAVPVVLRTGATARDIAALGSGEAIDALTALAPESSLILPINAKGRVIGMLSLYRGAGRHSFSDDEIATATEIAARAGLTLENARLYAQQRGLAEGLQRSLLTKPPEPDHCQIAVRYVPAAEIASVGGDWFDSFLQPGGATTLVIGDVVGHDTAAAAAMGQVRGLLRGIAWHSGAGPAEVLTGVDAAMEGLQLQTTATAVVARLEQTPAELGQDLTRLRWSNAGHPPAMVVDDDGSFHLLAGPEADLLLGIDPGTDRTEHQIELHRGATILLYTDGLVERRGHSLDEGFDRLRDALLDLIVLPLEALCDQLLERLGGDADDDIALIAVRLHPQDRPRPPEAGPEDIPPNVPQEP